MRTLACALRASCASFCASSAARRWPPRHAASSLASISAACCRPLLRLLFRLLLGRQVRRDALGPDRPRDNERRLLRRREVAKVLVLVGQVPGFNSALNGLLWDDGFCLTPLKPVAVSLLWSLRTSVRPSAAAAAHASSAVMSLFACTSSAVTCRGRFLGVARSSGGG